MMISLMFVPGVRDPERGGRDTTFESGQGGEDLVGL